MTTQDGGARKVEARLWADYNVGLVWQPREKCVWLEFHCCHSCMHQQHMTAACLDAMYAWRVQNMTDYVHYVVEGRQLSVEYLRGCGVLVLLTWAPYDECNVIPNVACILKGCSDNQFPWNLVIAESRYLWFSVGWWQIHVRKYTEVPQRLACVCSLIGVFERHPTLISLMNEMNLLHAFTNIFETFQHWWWVNHQWCE